MTKNEIFKNIRRNKHKKSFAVELIAGFLGIGLTRAKNIYEKEYLFWNKQQEEIKIENHIVKTPKRRRLERSIPKGVGNDWEEAYQYTDR